MVQRKWEHRGCVGEARYVHGADGVCVLGHERPSIVGNAGEVGVEVVGEVEEPERCYSLVLHRLDMVFVSEADQCGHFAEGADWVRVRRLVAGKEWGYQSLGRPSRHTDL